MNINRSFEILEISPNATYEEAKAAYRLMCWYSGEADRCSVMMAIAVPAQSRPTKR
jgi:hypothetical protein